MTQDMMTLRALLEKSSDADLLREMIGFTAERLMALEVEGLTGAAHGERSADRITHRNGQTQVLDLPVSAMIDEFPSPSSLFRMIRARQTCFCELFGSATIACNR